MFLRELEKNEADTSIADTPEKVSGINTNTMLSMLRAHHMGPGALSGPGF